MRSARVVIEPLFLDRTTHVEGRKECMFVNEFVAGSSVEALDTAVLRRFSRINNVAKLGIERTIRESCRRATIVSRDAVYERL
jgi:hypothetical protein